MTFLKVAPGSFGLPWQPGASKHLSILALEGCGFISVAQGAGLAAETGGGAAGFAALSLVSPPPPHTGRQRWVQGAGATVWANSGPSLGPLCSLSLNHSQTQCDQDMGRCGEEQRAGILSRPHTQRPELFWAPGRGFARGWSEMPTPPRSPLTRLHTGFFTNDKALPKA